MKHLMAVLFLLFMMPALAGTVSSTSKFTWDYPVEGLDDIDGFRLYCVDQVVWQGVSQIATIADTVMTTGKQDCYVKAYNTLGESGPSNVVEAKYVNAKPTNNPNNFKLDAAP